ncbi:class I SAM-dependent methyltransferase family protein [Polyangium sp. 6x1]|uniref:class I SAM-dependent methyltransferase family protein n=1 Tax=Polyangium sp. 6x1 TaxID=3042689 RepID=UPI00248227CD|nr:class I SAM-dependent methyltransferase family protein [Polyangium sp. 6x1]MDI1451008.1 class I SAM-dependent methyltransferase family protein [Polyangium sp. 6x1]
MAQQLARESITKGPEETASVEPPAARRSREPLEDEVSGPPVSPECERRLAELATWCRDLEASPRCALPPSPEDSARLGEMLRGIWAASDALGPMGLLRNSPAQRRFQEVLGEYFWQSPIIHRCFAKPRGYAGDFLMMEDVYRNRPKGETTLGRWMDRWVLEEPGFVAVRNRRAKLETLLRDEWTSGARHVMNVASGSASELADVVPTNPFQEVTLLDQDQGALFAATTSLGRRMDPARVRTWSGSVFTLIRGKTSLVPGDQDFIYSIGLYDYLSPRFATALTARLWLNLAPGGLLAIGNFNGHNPMRRFIEAAMDWYLIYRDEPDMLGLAVGLPNVEEAEVWTDPTGCLHLLLARKRGARPAFGSPA